MFGAVAVGMLNHPNTGITIAVAHYLSALAVGLLMRFYGDSTYSKIKQKNKEKNIFMRSIKALYTARQQDGRHFGKLMGDSIVKSLDTLMIVGGFIIIFSVIIRILSVVGIVSILTTIFSYLLIPIGLSTELTASVVKGLFEVTLGSQDAAGLSHTIPFDQKIIIISFIIAWSGFSVHAQVASIISKTDMSIIPFLMARFIHGILAGFFTYLILNPLQPLLQTWASPVFLQRTPGASTEYWFDRTLLMGSTFFGIIIFMLALSLFVHFLKKRKENI